MTASFYRFAWITILALISAVSLLHVFWGDIDIDEEFYISLAWFVSEGNTPYYDFFYTQTPLLPYVYGFILKPFGIQLVSARLLSTAFTLGSVVFSMQIERKRDAGDWNDSLIVKEPAVEYGADKAVPADLDLLLQNCITA
jgi:hypothetical protein